MNAARRLQSMPALVTARSAEIQGQIVSVPAASRGTVQRVLVEENQVVRKGDALVELRPARPARILPSALEASWTARLNSPDVRSPVEGRVVQLEVEAHDAIERSQPVMAILQGDDVWIVADFDPYDLEGIRPGQLALVQAGGVEFTARIEWIDASGSALMEFEDEGFNPAEILRPGAPAEVTVDRSQPRLHLR